MGLTAGASIGDKYELIGQIGEGGMGVVWRARHRELGTDVAIKVLREEALRDREAVARFDREAHAAAALRGPHVARIFDVGRLEDGAPFMVMEFLEGKDLGAELLARGPLPVAEAVTYVLQAAEAMVEAHAIGIVHRDLKPENLFAIHESGKRIIKILDFGISKFHREGEMRVTQTQSSFGTPLYMSPEQVRSTRNVDHRTDIWSLGVILYELLTGEVPFYGETPTAVAVAITVEEPIPITARRAEIPPGLGEIVGIALRKQAGERYADVSEFIAALRPYADAGFVGNAAWSAPSTNVSLSRTVVGTPLEPTRKAAPMWMIGVGIGALVGVLVAGGVWLSRTSSTGPIPIAPKDDKVSATSPVESSPVNARGPEVRTAPDAPTSASSVASVEAVPTAKPTGAARTSAEQVGAPSKPSTAPTTTTQPPQTPTQVPTVRTDGKGNPLSL